MTGYLHSLAMRARGEATAIRPLPVPLLAPRPAQLDGAPEPSSRLPVGPTAWPEPRDPDQAADTPVASEAEQPPVPLPPGDGRLAPQATDGTAPSPRNRQPDGDRDRASGVHMRGREATAPTTSAAAPTQPAARRQARGEEDRSEPERAEPAAPTPPAAGDTGDAGGKASLAERVDPTARRAPATVVAAALDSAAGPDSPAADPIEAPPSTDRIGPLAEALSPRPPALVRTELVSRGAADRSFAAAPEVGTVEISIGHIELVAPPPSPAPVSATAPAKLSLDDYLRERDKGFA